MHIVIATLLSIMIAAAANADESKIKLKQAPGVEKIEANCVACHSLDYLPMNAPFLNRAGWDAEVAKMINAFGAPIEDADAKVIGDYLQAHYGR